MLLLLLLLCYVIITIQAQGEAQEENLALMGEALDAYSYC